MSQQASAPKEKEEKEEKEEKVGKQGLFLEEADEPDMSIHVYNFKGDAEESVFKDLVEVLSKSPITASGDMISKTTESMDATGPYWSLRLINHSLTQAVSQNSVLPWVMSLTLGKGVSSSNHSRYFINKTSIFISGKDLKTAERNGYTKNRVLNELDKFKGLLKRAAGADPSESADAIATLSQFAITKFKPPPPRKQPAPKTPSSDVVEPPAKKSKQSTIEDTISKPSPAPPKKPAAPPRKKVVKEKKPEDELPAEPNEENVGENSYDQYYNPEEDEDR